MRVDLRGASASELGAGDGLLYRYRQPSRRGKGAFGICSFWAVEYLALGGGSVEEARRAVRRSWCGYAQRRRPLRRGDRSRRPARALGNFPQAFTHVGLINAALSLGAPRARRSRARVEYRAGAREAHA